MSARDLEIPINHHGTCYIFPIIGGFVGGDTVAGMLATRLDAMEGPTLLVDFGTNSEIVSAHDGRLLAASTAAGPAFEGAMISDTTRQALQSKCRALCEAFSLESAYIAIALGPRRHYLAGCGTPTASTSGKLFLSKDIVLFWHGDLSWEASSAFRNDLTDTVRGIERELTAKSVASFETNCHHKGNTKHGA